jgi:hypothetical protein
LDAKVVVDIASQTVVSRVFTSKKDPDILIVKDTNDKLVSATKKDKATGKSTEIILISKGAAPMPWSPRTIWTTKGSNCSGRRT